MASFLTPDDIKNIPTGQSVGSVLLNKNLRRIKRPNEKNKVGFQGKTQMELPSATLARQRFGGAVPRVKGEVPLNTPAYKNYIEKPPWERIKIYDVNDQLSTLKEMYRYYNLGNVVHPGLALGVLFSPALNRESVPFLFQGENFRNKLKELSKKYQPETILQTTQLLKDPARFLGSYIGQKIVDIPVVKDVLKGAAQAAASWTKLPAQLMLEQVETSQNIKLGAWTTPWKYPWGKSKGQVEGEQFWRGKASAYIDAVNKVVASEELRPENEIAGAIGGAGFSIAAAVVTTLATKSPAAAGAMFGGIAKGSGYERARTKGVEPSRASMFSTAQGLAEGGLEAWGLHKLLAPSAGLVGVAKKMATEAIQESSQEVAGAGIGKVGGYEDRTLNAIAKDVVLSGAIGAVMGGTVGATIDLATEQKIIKDIQQGYGMSKQEASATYKAFTKMQNMLGSEAGFADFSKKKPSQLSKKTEERATAEKVIDKPLKELTEYETREMAAGIAKAREFTAKNTEKAIKIALGEKQAPKNIFSGRIYKAVEKYAKETKDIELIKKLVSSPLAKQFSEKGQEIQALYDPEQDYWTSPVEIVKDVTKALKAQRLTKMWRVKKVDVKNIVEKIEPAAFKTILDLTDKVSKTRAAIEKGGDRLEYGRNLVALQNYVAALKNPRLKMGLWKTIRDVTPAEVIKHPLKTTKDVFGLSKAIRATADDSFTLRQGIKMMFSEPKVWFKQTLKSFSNIVRTFGGTEVMDEVNADIISRPNSLNGVYKAMKLPIAVLEEDIPVQIQEKIPVVGKVFKAADAAFTAFAQTSRAEIADKYYKIAQETGVETTSKWFEDAGKLIGALTARGRLGKLEPVADTVNVLFFSPRKLKADIDFLTMPFDARLSPDVRNKSAKNLLRTTLGLAIILGIARAMGAEIEPDPRSANFGTIRIGSTRFDITGGLKAIIVLATRLLAWGGSYFSENLGYFKSSKTGKMTTRKDSNILSATGEQMVIDFLRSKESPGMGLLSSLGRGKDFEGQPPTLEKEIKNLFTPLISQVPSEIGKDADSAPLLAALLAEFFGVSAQTYTSPDNPLIKEDKEWEADMSAKDKNGEFILTNKEKFNARFQWRKEISPYLDKLAKQRNKKAGQGWAEFRKIWNERNTDLENEYISPDSDNFNQEVWDRELNKILRKHPAFSNQWDNIPQKLILR